MDGTFTSVAHGESVAPTDDASIARSSLDAISTPSAALAHPSSRPLLPAPGRKRLRSTAAGALSPSAHSAHHISSLHAVPQASTTADMVAQCFHLSSCIPTQALCNLNATPAQTMYMLETLLTFRSEDHLVTHNTMPDELCMTARTLLQTGKASVSLDDPAAALRMETRAWGKCNSWVRAGNAHVVTDDKDVRAVDNITKIDSLRNGFKDDPEPRVCVSVALDGLFLLSSSTGPDSPAAYALDLIPCHNQRKDFDEESGSTAIDEGKVFAKAAIGNAAERHRGLYLEGKDSLDALRDVIREEELVVVPLSDPMIAVLVPDYDKNLRARTSADKTFAPAIITLHPKTENVCVFFHSTQMGTAIASPSVIHRAGDFGISFFHEFSRAYLTLVGAPNVEAVFPVFTTVEDSPLHKLLTPKGAAEFTKLFQQHRLLPPGRVLMAPGTAAGKASHATDEGEEKGVHYSEQLQRKTMSSAERAEASNATDEGEEKGVHYSEHLQRKTMSLADRAKSRLSKPPKDRTAEQQRKNSQKLRADAAADAKDFVEKLNGEQGKQAQREAVELYKTEKLHGAGGKGRKLTTQRRMGELLRLKGGGAISTSNRNVSVMMADMEKAWPELAQ